MAESSSKEDSREVIVPHQDVEEEPADEYANEEDADDEDHLEEPDENEVQEVADQVEQSSEKDEFVVGENQDQSDEDIVDKQIEEPDHGKKSPAKPGKMIGGFDEFDLNEDQSEDSLEKIDVKESSEDKAEELPEPEVKQVIEEDEDMQIEEKQGGADLEEEGEEDGEYKPPSEPIEYSSLVDESRITSEHFHVGD